MACESVEDGVVHCATGVEAPVSVTTGPPASSCTVTDSSEFSDEFPAADFTPALATQAMPSKAARMKPNTSPRFFMTDFLPMCSGFSDIDGLQRFQVCQPVVARVRGSWWFATPGVRDQRPHLRIGAI